MVLTANEVLQRAAARSQRLAELEVAHKIVEGGLGYEIGEEQAPWMCVMSMPYIHTECACQSIISNRAL